MPTPQSEVSVHVICQYSRELLPRQKIAEVQIMHIIFLVQVHMHTACLSLALIVLAPPFNALKTAAAPTLALVCSQHPQSLASLRLMFTSGYGCLGSMDLIIMNIPTSILMMICG